MKAWAVKTEGNVFVVFPRTNRRGVYWNALRPSGKLVRVEIREVSRKVRAKRRGKK